MLASHCFVPVKPTRCSLGGKVWFIWGSCRVSMIHICIRISIYIKLLPGVKWRDRCEGWYVYYILNILNWIYFIMFMCNLNIGGDYIIYTIFEKNYNIETNVIWNIGIKCYQYSAWYWRVNICLITNFFHWLPGFVEVLLYYSTLVLFMRLIVSNGKSNYSIGNISGQKIANFIHRLPILLKVFCIILY